MVGVREAATRAFASSVRVALPQTGGMGLFVLLSVTFLGMGAWFFVSGLTFWAAPTGAGLLVMGWALKPRPSLVALDGDPSAGTIHAQFSDGVEAVWPRDVIRSAKIEETYDNRRAGGHRTYAPTLLLAGGEEAVLFHSESEAVAGQVLADLHRMLEVVERRAFAELEGDARQRLEDSPRVQLEGGDAASAGYRQTTRAPLTATWSARTPWSRLRAPAVLLAGAAFTVGGVFELPPSYLAAATGGAWIMMLAIHLARGRGATRLSLTEDRLELRRAGEERTLALEEIADVTVSWAGELALHLADGETLRLARGGLWVSDLHDLRVVLSAALSER